MDIQDLLEHYGNKFQSEPDPEKKKRWEYYVDELVEMLINQAA